MALARLVLVAAFGVFCRREFLFCILQFCFHRLKLLSEYAGLVFLCGVDLVYGAYSSLDYETV